MTIQACLLVYYTQFMKGITFFFFTKHGSKITLHISKIFIGGGLLNIISAHHPPEKKLNKIDSQNQTEPEVNVPKYDTSKTVKDKAYQS